MPINPGLVEYFRGAELPVLSLWLWNDAGSLIDLSSGYTFSVKIGSVGKPAVLTKVSGVIGAAGSGVAPTGVPNLRVVWAAGELDILPGSYQFQITATSAGLDRRFAASLRILDVVV